MKKNINKIFGLRIPEVPFYIISFVWLYIVLSNFFKYHKVNFNISYLFEITGQFKFLNFLNLLVEYIHAVVVLCGIILAAFFLGSKIIGLIKIKFSSQLEKFVFSIGIGLGALAYLTLLLGVIGLLYSGVFYILWLTLLILGIKEIIPLLKNIKLKQKEMISFPYKIIILFLFLVVIFNFLMSFTPEMFYDSLNYHVGVPNFYRVNHRILPVPFKLASHYPLTVSMLYLFGIVLRSEIIPKLINFSFGILIIMGIIYFCRIHFKSLKTGFLSATVFYTTSTVITKLWSASNDIGLTLFTFLSLAALIKSLTEKNHKWLILSAIFAGLIMGTKYTGIFFIFGLLPLFIFLKMGLSEKIKKIFLWGLISVAVFSPWLIKNYIHSRNPVHPFMERYFNVNPLHRANFKASAEFLSKPTTHIQKFQTLLTMPWELSIKGGGTQRFASPDYYMIGAVFLAFIPLFFLLKDKNKESNSSNADKKTIYYLLIFAAFSYVFWGLFSSQKIRFFSPAIPALSIVAGYTIFKISQLNKIAGKIFLIIFFLLILRNFFFLIPMAHNAYKPFSVLTGSMSKDKYLSTSHPGYPHPSYSVYKYINENLPQNTKVLIFGDAKCYYIRRNFTAFSVQNLNPLIEYLGQVNDGDEFYSYLKNLNYTHIVVNIGEGVRTAGYETLYFSKNDFKVLDEFWNRHIKKLYNSGSVFLYEIIADTVDFSAPENTIKQTYRIYKMREINNHISNKNWKEAIAPLNDLLNKGISDREIHYLIGVCYYNSGKYEKAKKHAKVAHRLKPDETTLKLLEVLENF